MQSRGTKTHLSAAAHVAYEGFCVFKGSLITDSNWQQLMHPDTCRQRDWLTIITHRERARRWERGLRVGGGQQHITKTHTHTHTKGREPKMHESDRSRQQKLKQRMIEMWRQTEGRAARWRQKNRIQMRYEHGPEGALTLNRPVKSSRRPMNSVSWYRPCRVRTDCMRTGLS